MPIQRPTHEEQPRMVTEAEIPSGVDRGWWPIIEDLQQKLDAVSPGWRPIQVKEKFGRLRVYASPGEINHAEVELDEGKKLPVLKEAPFPDESTRTAFNSAISEAERLSADTCEECGAPAGLMRTARGWLKTICTGCAERSDEGFQPVGEG